MRLIIPLFLLVILGGSVDAEPAPPPGPKAMVAAAKALPGRTVRSAHGLFAAAANPAQQIKFTVSPVRAGRSFASAGMAYARGQVLTADGRIIASFTQDAMIRAFAPGLGL